MKKEIYQLLEKLGINYTCLEHPPIMTTKEGMPIAQTLNVTPCKNLFLVNKQKEYFLVMILGDKKISIKNIARQIGSSRLTFASNEDLDKFLFTMPGSVSILGLIYDKENKVKLLIDKEILKTDYISCHPCENTYSLKLKTKDITDILLPAINHTDFKEISLEDL
ncbi:prolyl-tRNA synthetase associated domain-containing protein [uncultured Parabacteroides sp.]|uniref:prolyl-tRNA synthetase associated domain-containing protein n=1 Tax=uncultured Parabacteroides sp. TaxID=512312 RepID=UPI0026293B6A|nr:prolyl-tRNA synthetase associated domain-containing protein [uncultured Parabacteroides sp.]